MMAHLDTTLLWDDEHTVAVAMVYVCSYDTNAVEDVLGPAPPIRVCWECRGGRSLCRCPWRRPEVRR